MSVELTGDGVRLGGEGVWIEGGLELSWLGWGWEMLAGEAALDCATAGDRSAAVTAGGETAWITIPVVRYARCRGRLETSGSNVQGYLKGREAWHVALQRVAEEISGRRQDVHEGGERDGT